MNKLGNAVYEVIDILVANRGTSQGKSSVVNGSFKFMCEVKWTISLGTKVGKGQLRILCQIPINREVLNIDKQKILIMR